MLFTRNFHPEWGYFAPSRNFVRTVRIVLIAVSVGGMAGASVVLSLVERPADETSVAARTLARPGEVVSVPVGTPRAVQVNTQAAIQDRPTKPAPTDATRAASGSSASSSTQPPTSIAALPKFQRRALPRRQSPRLIKRPQLRRRRCKRRRPGSSIRRRVTAHAGST